MVRFVCGMIFLASVVIGALLFWHSPRLQSLADADMNVYVLYAVTAGMLLLSTLYTNRAEVLAECRRTTAAWLRRYRDVRDNTDW